MILIDIIKINDKKTLHCFCIHIFSPKTHKKISAYNPNKVVKELFT